MPPGLFVLWEVSPCAGLSFPGGKGKGGLDPRLHKLSVGQAIRCELELVPVAGRKGRCQGQKDGGKGWGGGGGGKGKRKGK